MSMDKKKKDGALKLCKNIIGIFQSERENNDSIYLYFQF